MVQQSGRSRASGSKAGDGASSKPAAGTEDETAATGQAEPATTEAEAGPDTQEDTSGPGVTLVNPGTTSVVYDQEGRTLDPGSRTEVEATDQATWRAVATGQLLAQDGNGDWVTFDDDGKVSPRPITVDGDE